MVACAKVIAFFFGCFLVFCLLLKNTIKIGFFDDFEMLIFSFFGQKSRVNNLAMVESITWPFFAKILPRKMAKLLTLLFFTLFLLKLVFFFKNLILPAERRRFLKNNKTQQKKKKQMAKLLTFDGQVINPTAYIITKTSIKFFVLGARLRMPPPIHPWLLKVRGVFVVARRPTKNLFLHVRYGDWPFRWVSDDRGPTETWQAAQSRKTNGAPANERHAHTHTHSHTHTHAHQRT